MSHKIFQTQKGVNFTLPKTYPYMTLSNNTNNLAVLAVCKNFIMMAHFLTSGITVHLLPSATFVYLFVYIFFQRPRPSPIALEPCVSNRAAVLSLIVRMPTGGKAYAPNGYTGIAIASSLVTLGLFINLFTVLQM